MAVRRRARTTVITAALLLLLLTGLGVLTVGGYFESTPFAINWPFRRTPRYPLAAVYWSGDMGMRIGPGKGIVDSLRARGIPVLSVSSPMLFGRSRDRAFVDRSVSDSLSMTLAQSRAERIAVIGSAFGADIVGSGLGRVDPDMRRRIATVVLVLPSSEAYFHANPSGIFYTGPAAADPAHTIPLLHGLRVTCIFIAGEDPGLCDDPVMGNAHRVSIDGDDLLWFDRPHLSAAVDAAVLDPPEPMH